MQSADLISREAAELQMLRNRWSIHHARRMLGLWGLTSCSAARVCGASAAT